MTEGLEPGETAEVEIEVTLEMTAVFPDPIGPVHPLYATWSMVQHMEWAARKVLQPHLKEGKEGVGCAVDVEHYQPCQVGELVRVEAEAVEVESDELVCAVRAYNEGELLGEGEVVQKIVDKEEFSENYGR